MWRCCSQIASEYMKFYINPLRLVSAPPPPPSPSYQLRPFFLRLGCLSPPLLLLHVVYRGVPKQLPLTKVLGIQLKKKKSLQSSFSLPLGTRTFSQHPSPKNALPSSSVINPRTLFPFFLLLQFFHPSLINANFSCRKIFGTSLLTLFGVSLVFWRGGRQITSVATPFYCRLSPNAQTSEFLIYSFYTFKIFC
jgi:hypothetical protein